MPLYEAKQKCVEQQKVSWSDRVRCGVLHRVKKDRNVMDIIKGGKAN